MTYAGLLVAVGLVMAYTNSVESGSAPLSAGTTLSRGLMWAGIAVIVFILATAFDYHWLKTLAWPIYGLQLGLLVLTLAIGDGVGGAARWVSVGPIGCGGNLRRCFAASHPFVFVGTTSGVVGYAMATSNMVSARS